MHAWVAASHPASLHGIRSTVSMCVGVCVCVCHTCVGDSDGGSEMNSTMGYMRQFLGAFRDQASSVRIFW